MLRPKTIQTSVNAATHLGKDFGAITSLSVHLAWYTKPCSHAQGFTCQHKSIARKMFRKFACYACRCAPVRIEKSRDCAPQFALSHLQSSQKRQTHPASTMDVLLLSLSACGVRTQGHDIDAMRNVGKRGRGAIKAFTFANVTQVYAAASEA